jgi:hypothetical protein
MKLIGLLETIGVGRGEREVGAGAHRLVGPRAEGPEGDAHVAPQCVEEVFAVAIGVEFSDLVGRAMGAVVHTSRGPTDHVFHARHYGPSPPSGAR